MHISLFVTQPEDGWAWVNTASIQNLRSIIDHRPQNFLHTTYHTRRIYYIPHSIHTVCPPYYIYAYTKNFFIPHSIHAEFLTNHTIYTQNVFHSTAQNSPVHSRGGGTIETKTDFLKVFKWILLSFQYIRTGKKEFLNLVTVLTLHIDPQNLKITM